MLVDFRCRLLVRGFLDADTTGYQYICTFHLTGNKQDVKTQRLALTLHETTLQLCVILPAVSLKAIAVQQMDMVMRAATVL